MSKTLAEAKAEAKAEGIPDEDLTPAVLKRYQWEPSNPLQGINPSPVETDEEVRDNLALLEEERKNNALPVHVSKALGKVLPMAFKLLG